MAWGYVAVAGATLVAGYMSSQAASDASDAQIGAANRANQTQLNEYQQTRADQTPWRQAGVKALSQMQNSDYMRDFTASDFKTDPGYQFNLEEGQKAIERAASARGNMGSGATLKALTSYSQNVASNEYQNAYDRFNADRDRRYNRLASLAGTGQTAQTQVNQAGQNYANNVAQNNLQAGNAAAANSIAQGNAANQTISGLANNWMQYQMMNRNNAVNTAPTGTSGYGGSYGSYATPGY